MEVVWKRVNERREEDERKIQEKIKRSCSSILQHYHTCLHICPTRRRLEPQRKHILLGDRLLQQIYCSRNNVPNVGKFKLLLMIIISEGGIVMLVLH